MLRLLKRLVLWLEARFPEKLVVVRADYDALRTELDARYKDLTSLTQRVDAELSILREDYKAHEQGIAAVVDRVGRVEASAVHKGAVQDLVAVVKTMKDEYASFKTSMGFKTGMADLEAMFNGEPITGDK